MYIERKYQKQVLSYLKHSPVIGIIGPRQCGKSTFIQNLPLENSLYLDLENREERLLLENPFLFFRSNSERVICLDEVQYSPEIFIDIKSHIDREQKNGSFIVLGSASPALLKQSSETMAGRILYIEMTNFLWSEVKNQVRFEDYFLLGGYPKALLAEEKEMGFVWIKNYIQTFFERDLLQITPGIQSQEVRRLFSMLAHLHGQELNINNLSKSLGIGFATTKSYIDTLIGSFQLFSLQAYYKNTKKRLVKSPKIYISDHGVLHHLLRISDSNQLLNHPTYGFSFESMIIKNIMYEYPEFEYSFYKTSNGAELDLVIETGSKTIGIEIKATSTPKLSRGFWNAIEDIKADEAWVIAEVQRGYHLKENVRVVNIEGFLSDFRTEEEENDTE